MSGSFLIQAVLKITFLIMLVLVASTSRREARPIPVRVRR
jgi:hypothetical protein